MAQNEEVKPCFHSSHWDALYPAFQEMKEFLAPNKFVAGLRPAFIFCGTTDKLRETCSVMFWVTVLESIVGAILFAVIAGFSTAWGMFGYIVYGLFTLWWACWLH